MTGDAANCANGSHGWRADLRRHGELDTAVRHKSPLVCVISLNGGWTAELATLSSKKGHAHQKSQKATPPHTITATPSVPFRKARCPHRSE